MKTLFAVKNEVAKYNCSLGINEVSIMLKNELKK